MLLDESDVCFYYLVRTNGGFSESVANSRIDNFKKKPEKYKDNPTVWKYKISEIQNFSLDVARLLNGPDFKRTISSFGGAALIPIPTSKPKSSENYDTRLINLCRSVTIKVPNVWIDDVFDVTRQVKPSHEGGSRQVDFLKNVITFGELSRETGLVILIDDVITKGTHYVACRDLIREKYPEISIIGVFLAIHKSDYVDYGVVEL